MRYTYTIMLGGSDQAMIINSNSKPELIGQDDNQFIMIDGNWLNANYVVTILCKENEKRIN